MSFTIMVKAWYICILYFQSTNLCIWDVIFITVAVNDFEGLDITPSIFQDLCKETEIDEEQIFTIYAGLHELLQCALKLPVTKLKPEVFKEDLMDLKLVFFKSYLNWYKIIMNLLLRSVVFVWTSANFG